MKKIFCCLAQDLFHCLHLWTTVRLHGKKLQNATKDLNPLWKAKKKYARYALLQKTKGYISYETIFSLSSTLISNNVASLAKGQILGLG